MAAENRGRYHERPIATLGLELVDSDLISEAGSGWTKTLIYGHETDEHQNPREIKVFNRPFSEGFLVRWDREGSTPESPHMTNRQTLYSSARSRLVSRRGWRTAVVQNIGWARVCGPSGRSCSKLRGGGRLTGSLCGD
jgi:hypothetical protein